MLPVGPLGDKFWKLLVEIDMRIGEAVAAGGCPHCDGRLHRADYPRKPRDGLLGLVEEAFAKRISYCCGRVGCRRRATPPSVRFLGRRIYVGVTVVVAVILARGAARASEIRRRTTIPARTVARWQAWWQTDFPRSRLYRAESARFMPPLSVAGLPATLVERFAGAKDGMLGALRRTLAFLAPLTTASVTDGSRFVRLP